MTGTIEPPYQRIVADIRRRIEDGRLTPGDRVPSTRQIARDWGVALATATKALTTLRQEGLVRAQPRVGTVVAPLDSGANSRPAQDGPRRRARPAPAAEQELTRERIVRAAIEIADAEGLHALSMRGVAARLGVATMSTYRHVAGKDDLVILMADAAFGEHTYAEPPPTGWRAQLEVSARAMWTLYRLHPWLAQFNALTRPLPLPNLLVHGERILNALDGQGFDPTTTLDLQVLLYSYVQGLAVHLEREAHAQAITGLSEDQWMEVHGPALGSIAATGRYPAFARLTDAFAEDGGYDLDLNKLFELGLRTLLDGFARLFEEKRRERGGAA